MLVLLPLLSGAVASFHVACNASGAGGGAVAEPPLASAAGAGVDDLLLEEGASACFTSLAAAACVGSVSVPAVLSLPTGFAASSPCTLTCTRFSRSPSAEGRASDAPPAPLTPTATDGGRPRERVPRASEIFRASMPLGPCNVLLIHVEMTPSMRPGLLRDVAMKGWLRASVDEARVSWSCVVWM